MRKRSSLTVVVPALNEGENLEQTIAGLINALEDNGIDWEIILINDGSNDSTGNTATNLVHEEPRIKVVHHRRPMGIGYCFRDGIALSGKDAITWFPGDGENDPHELIKYLSLLEHVDIIVPFVFNPHVRSWGRRILSKFYLWVINLFFGTTFSYTNGNVIYHRRIFEIVKPASNGFLYQAECLIKAVRAGFTFAEVPVRLKKRVRGRSKAISLKSLFCILREFIALLFTVHFLAASENTAGRSVNLEED